MRIYISADFEGTSGVTSPRQCFPGSTEFEHARRRWIGDVNAAVEGAISGGATEVLVNEAHAAMNYLLPEHLHPKAAYISGYVKADNQMEGLDSSFAGAIYMGHAMAGTASGVLNHTYVMRDVVAIRLNGDPIGEFGLNAHWAAYHGVPMILAVGDDQLAAEARSLVPGIETAVVKKGISQFTARNLPVEEARGVIRQAAERATRRAAQMPKLPRLESYGLEIDFSLSEIASLVCLVPGVERVGARAVRYTARDYRQIQHMRIVCTNLALAVVQQHFQGY